MDKFEMDKSMMPGLVSGAQVKDLLAQFEGENEVKLFISNFVRTFETLSDIYDKDQSDFNKTVGALLQIMNYFSYYQQELNRMAEIFNPTEVSEEQLNNFKMNPKNKIIDFL